MNENTFNTALQKELVMDETVRTENGAVMHASTGKAFLDAFWKISSCRGIRDEHEIVKIFAPCFDEDFTLACRLLFYIRDCRQGCGEKRTFNILFKWLLGKSDYAAKLGKLIPEYGSWKDIVTLAYETDNSQLYQIIIDQFHRDVANAKAEKAISLLAKWMPSINTSSKNTVAMAKTFIKKLGVLASVYRRVLSRLRARLKVIERAMCEGKWDEIDYNAVPSKANLIYRNAFLKHDEVRRRDYLSKLAKGDEDVKINASVLEPYEIVHQYFMKNEVDYWSGSVRCNTQDETCESLWKNLPRTDVLHGKNMICVHDNSGSMSSNISDGNGVTCRDVADSLAIYCSELLTGPWKDKFITFSESPKIVDLSYDYSLLQKLSALHKKMQCENTNIERVFDLILDIAVENQVKQEEIPNVLVLSDMEFDGCVISDMGHNYGWYGNPRRLETLFEAIRKKFRNAGYEMPKLIFWNIGSRTMGIPVRENENGVALVSGFSKNIFNMVASGKLDPFDCLKEQLMRPRYDAVEKTLNDE